MVTPFGGQQIPIVLNMNQDLYGTTDLGNSGPPNIFLASGTTNIGFHITQDWDNFKGTAYWSVVWGHLDASTATGGMKLILVDDTNGTTLYTFSSNSTAAVGNGFLTSTAIATSVTFTKPSGQAKIRLKAQNSDTTSRTCYFWQSHIVIVF